MIHGLCNGVLTKNITMPECIRNLTPPMYRKTEFVQEPVLKQAFLSVPADRIYDYQHMGFSHALWKAYTTSSVQFRSRPLNQR